MKRFYLSLAAVGTTAALLTAGSFALFTANTTNVNNTFTAGTVKLGTPISSLINIANIAPGDFESAGSFKVTYTGNLAAWLGVTATPTGALFAGTTPLTATLWESANAYPVDGVRRVVGSTPVLAGHSKTFTVKYNLPHNAGNSYQAATGSITLSVEAVQSKNNTLPVASPGAPGPISWN